MITELDALDRLIMYFNRLPGIGKKTAQRLAFYVLKSDNKFSSDFASALTEVKQQIQFCTQCNHISSGPLCAICASVKRNQSIICLVADFTDIFAIEKTNEYQGVYHVLGGVLSPLDSIGPDQLNIKNLMTRLRNSQVDEIVMALTSTTEGEATVTYLTHLLQHLEIKLTRIARGIPLGTELEFLDHATLGRAIQSRSAL